MSSESHLPDEIARILADPVRLHLLTIIARMREISCTHLVDHADVGASTVSYHVKMLTEAGLVTVAIDGRRRYVDSAARSSSTTQWTDSSSDFPRRHPTDTKSGNPTGRRGTYNCCAT
ncbi:ArsR family transcriptional regulator [Rhodococcus opacus M213]|uniref:ArsR family transcriptional regulator n=1 Tax=Rhodococcus opacus M213 TaxID=1129896 RepID=K8X842_RHOOP|nr:helix-turn-helix transcriptional regulator [Rhodococcus opacus]EKT77638.1 ArsR family transcriptional regulator [Rhodococcus opacus M213]